MREQRQNSLSYTLMLRLASARRHRAAVALFLIVSRSSDSREQIRALSKFALSVRQPNAGGITRRIP